MRDVRDVGGDPVRLRTLPASSGVLAFWRSGAKQPARAERRVPPPSSIWMEMEKLPPSVVAGWDVWHRGMAAWRG